MTKKIIHFMGIGGSGMSACAIIAKKQGFVVSGCDIGESPYLSGVRKAGIPVSIGHDQDHIKNVNILAVSPAIYFSPKKHPEFVLGQKKVLLTWQEFTGKYLLKDKRVICISGTHGKSTVTTLSGLLYENAKLDPSVIVGANFEPWKANYRFGGNNIFIIEADEFYGNFLNYSPDSLIVNNIEYDHPDYFKNEDDVINTFAKLISKLSGNKLLIINQDSLGVKKLIQKISKKRKDSITIIGYTLSDKPLIKLNNSYKASVLKASPFGFEFEVVNKHKKYKQKFRLNMLGTYNVANVLGLICLAKFDNIPDTIIQKTLSKFPGTKRRLQLIKNVNGIKVYDDYAHHPTAIKVTLSALRQKYPKNKITCIVEPHTYSRTAKLLSMYKSAFNDCDFVIVAPIYRSRDTKTYGVDNKSVVKASGHKNALALNSFGEIITIVKEKAKKKDVIIVMGAGDSYQLAKELVEELK